MQVLSLEGEGYNALAAPYKELLESYPTTQSHIRKRLDHPETLVIPSMPLQKDIELINAFKPSLRTSYQQGERIEFLLSTKASKRDHHSMLLDI